MGTWGVGVWQDDVATDVRDEFEAALSSGLSVADATRYVLEHPPWPLDDEDEGPVTYLTLAALQLEHGALQPAIRDTALRIIASGAGMERWEDEGEDALPERLAVLTRFRGLLEKGACTPAELSAVTEPEIGGPWR